MNQEINKGLLKKNKKTSDFKIDFIAPPFEFYINFWYDHYKHRKRLRIYFFDKELSCSILKI